MWDCSRDITIGELRAVKTRYEAHFQTHPVVNGTALSLNQLVVLFKRPATPYLQKIFNEYRLPRASPAGLSFARTSENILTHRCDIPVVPPPAMAHTRRADLFELLVSVALTADGTFSIQILSISVYWHSSDSARQDNPRRDGNFVVVTATRQGRS